MSQTPSNPFASLNSNSAAKGMNRPTLKGSDGKPINPFSPFAGDNGTNAGGTNPFTEAEAEAPEETVTLGRSPFATPDQTKGVGEVEQPDTQNPDISDKLESPYGKSPFAFDQSEAQNQPQASTDEGFDY